jgi:hypothetical protein
MADVAEVMTETKAPTLPAATRAAQAPIAQPDGSARSQQALAADQRDLAVLRVARSFAWLCTARARHDSDD